MKCLNIARENLAVELHVSFEEVNTYGNRLNDSREWLIISFFRNGEKDDTKNYVGITVPSVVMKILQKTYDWKWRTGKYFFFRLTREHVKTKYL